MRLLIGLLFLSVILYSCEDPPKKEKKVNFLESKELTVTEKLQMCIEKNMLSEFGFNEEQSKWLSDFYKAVDYCPVWMNDSAMNEKGMKLKETIDRSLWLGIPKSRIKFKKNKNNHRVIEELLLTARSALIMQDLKTGMLVDSTKKYSEARFIDPLIYDSLLCNPDSVPYHRFFIDHSYTDTNYRYIAEHLYSFCESYPLDKSTFKVKTFKEDSVNAVPNARDALISKGYLAKSDTGQVLFEKALKLFQVHNGLKPDAKIGKYTAKALNESTYNKVLRASLSMDKIRQKAKYPKKYIRINIPEYLLRYYANDSLKAVHNIIVGTTDHQTPQLKSKVHSITVYPYWTVPQSIASNEILPALKRNSAYLTKNNYKIYRGDAEVNPFNVNWKKIKDKTFPYKVVQQPGPSNSLGIIKFEFYSNYSVYVHDTPVKYLFKTDVRSFSHGCMRCDKPVDLGKMVLTYDSLRKKPNPITADSLDSLIGLAENYKIKLLKQVPVFVEYQSVVASREKLVFYLDIYRRDEEYLKIMRD